MVTQSASSRQGGKNDNFVDSPPVLVYSFSMNVYDFDKTIYPRDSTAEFYLWCLKRYPKCRRTLGFTAFAFFCMGTRLKTKTKSKELFYRFLRYVPPEAPLLFWQEHIQYIRPWFHEQRRADDLIISASPAFLLAPAARMLEFALIASEVEQSTGLYHGENCHGAEKLRRFRAAYGGGGIEGFWSDSRGDAPLAAIAERAYLVKNGVPEPW